MKYIVLVYGVAALALAPPSALAQRTAVQQATPCPTGTVPVTRSDFAFRCNCAHLTEPDGTRRWEFYAEPVVDDVERNGHLYGVLRAGDAIVAVDGHLVTTEEGGRRFQHLQTGERVEVTYLRNGTLHTQRVDAAPQCTPGPTQTARAPRGRGPAVLDPEFPIAAGYLGLGISARASASRRPGQPIVWRFSEPPVISGLDPDGPAARAGLQVGDTLTHVDRVPITSEDGGRRFGAIRPGDTVAFFYSGAGRRGVRQVRATERPAADDTRPTTTTATAVDLAPLAAALRSIELARLTQASARFRGSLDDLHVEVSGPARIERVGDQIIVRSHDRSIVVIISYSSAER